MSQNNDEEPKSGIGQLGLTPEMNSYIIDNLPEGTLVARVIREHRERYAVSDGENEYDAEITGNMR